MRTTIAWVALLAALGCTNRVEVTPAPSEAKPTGTEPAARTARREAPPKTSTKPELDCPDGASATQLAIPAVDTVMTWCVRSVADARSVQHGPWRKQRGGTLVEEGAYREGERHGEWSFRWSSGELQSQGHYEDGHKTGVWSFWDDEGGLIRRVDYETPTPPVAESEADAAEAEAEAEQEEAADTVTVSLRFENSHASDLLFALEPWAEEYDLPPGSTVEVEATGPETGDLVVESSEEAITVWAWEGAEVQLWMDGIEVGP